MGCDRGTDFSVDFTRPVRDYFEEASLQNKNKVEIVGKQRNLEEKPEKKSEDMKENEIYTMRAREYEIFEGKGKDSKYLKPRYSSMVFPPPSGIEKKMITKDFKKKDVRVIQKNAFANANFVNQSLQTDTNSFEFDEWELDYDG